MLADHHPAQSGFTIVELVLAIVTFAFVGAAIAELTLGILSVQTRTSYLQAATRAAQTEVESLRNNNYNQLVNGSNIAFTVPSFLPGPRSGNVAISEPTPGMKRVDVTVSYTDHGTTETIELSSTIGIIGISQ